MGNWRCPVNHTLYLFGREGNGTSLQYSCLENPMDRGAWKAAVHGIAEGQTQLSDFTFTFYFPALEKEMAIHSSVLAWIIPGTGEPGGLPSMGSHRVGHDWSDLAAYLFEVQGSQHSSGKPVISGRWEPMAHIPHFTSKSSADSSDVLELIPSRAHSGNSVSATSSNCLSFLPVSLLLLSHSSSLGSFCKVN